MIIPIDDKTRIKGDEYQWTVQTRKTHTSSKTGELVEQWEFMLSASDLAGCVLGLYKRRIRTAEGEGIGDLMVAHENLSEQLRSALEPVFSAQEIEEIVGGFTP